MSNGMKREYIVVLVTAGNEEEGRKIAKGLLKEKWAACINIIPRVNSHFLWKGKIERSAETLLVIKTKNSCLNKVIRLVKKVHSYEVPEIIALSIVGGNRDYLGWIEESLKGGDSEGKN
jgi:periplasmic divalent cation tolerance protein